jgi:tetratricopeptide (TPR) repeat protein
MPLWPDLDTSGEVGAANPGQFVNAPGALPKAMPAAPENERQLARLRAAAAQFMAQRRYPLAAARLEDALALAPADPTVLAELGGALYWAGQYDQAASRYQAALALRPDHLAALDGLALVAVTQKRYPDARAHLQRLLQLTPDSPVLWLRYGDVEHRLGNNARALEAWRRLRSLPQVDAATRQKAEQRLNYFDPAQHHTQSTHGKVE